MASNDQPIPGEYRLVTQPDGSTKPMWFIDEEAFAAACGATTFKEVVRHRVVNFAAARLAQDQKPPLYTHSHFCCPPPGHAS